MNGEENLSDTSFGALPFKTFTRSLFNAGHCSSQSTTRLFPVDFYGDGAFVSFEVLRGSVGIIIQ